MTTYSSPTLVSWSKIKDYYSSSIFVPWSKEDNNLLVSKTYVMEQGKGLWYSLVAKTHAVEQDEDNKADNWQALDYHGKTRWPIHWDEQDKVDGYSLEKWHQLGTHTLQLTQVSDMNINL